MSIFGMNAAEKIELEKYRDSAVLVRIERQGRLNIFHFFRKGETFTFETYGSMEDDIAGWKKAAGLI